MRIPISNDKRVYEFVHSLIYKMEHWVIASLIPNGQQLAHLQALRLDVRFAALISTDM